MTAMKILHVFTNEAGKFGNPLGIVIDEKYSLDKNERQQITLNSGFSEVVFINNIQERNISIYSPQREIPFAGHAVVGTAYFFNQKFKILVTQLVTIKGVVDTWQEDNLTWVRGELAIAPSWKYEQLTDVSLVEGLSIEQSSSKEHTVVWAWIDQRKGFIRARTFASDWGIPEDEANGSGSMKLASDLGKGVVVYHGQGSVIYARPSKSGFAEVGGSVQLDRKQCKF